MPALLWIGVFLATFAGLAAASLATAEPGAWLAIGIFAILLALVLWVYRARGWQDQLDTLKKGGLILLPIILLAAIPIIAIVELVWVEPRIQQAFLTGLIIVLGWFATFVFQEVRIARDKDRRRRDTLFALRSEIYALVTKLDNRAIRDDAREVQKKISDGAGTDLWGRRAEYHPFATRESAPVVFDALSDAVPLLEDDTVDDVVRFYAEYTDLRALAEDARDPVLLALSADRRIAFHRQLTERRVTTLYFGLKALNLIKRDLDAENGAEIQLSGENADIYTEAGIPWRT